MKYSVRTILVATTLCALGLWCWLAMMSTFSWTQGITFGSSVDCPTYTLAQSEMDTWLTNNGFVAMSGTPPRQTFRNPESKWFKSVANPLMFVQTFSDSSTFGALVVVDSRASRIWLRSNKDAVERESNELSKRLEEWWNRLIIDHPLDFNVE